MARTGRPRKPRNLKVVKGNFPAKDKGKNKPDADGKKDGKRVLMPDAPAKPDHLDELETQIWDRLVEQLSKIGTLQRCDEGQLATYCGTYARMIRNKQVLAVHRKKEGDDFFETDGRHGKMIRVHPAVGVIERSEKALKSMAQEFGMTPSSRKAMGYDPKQLFLPFDEKPEDDDPTKDLVS